MYTSYFARVKSIKVPSIQLVSIALSAPKGFNGHTYTALNPTWEMISIKNNSRKYTEQYRTSILLKLDPYKVYEDIVKMAGDDAILLCYEAKGFCHRHIVAVWIEDALDIEIKELR